VRRGLPLVLLLLACCVVVDVTLLFVPLSQHVWCEFLQLSLWKWEGLCPMLFPLHLSEDRAGRHVAFPKGMV